MQSNDPAQILSQEQIADAINRAKIGSQRQKNEMMRLGTSDPTSFQMNFSKQLQDQAAPQDYLGAGGKLTNDLLPKQETYSYNDQSNNFDVSKIKWGTEGYNQQDLGDGRYNILDQSGNNLGIGYKSLDDTIQDLTKQYNNNIPTLDAFENSPEYKEYKTRVYNGEYAFAPKFPEKFEYFPELVLGGDLQRWEILGQLLNNKLPSYKTTSQRSFMGNNEDESIKGLNTLFGSTPLILNNKVAGYKFDSTPASDAFAGYQNPNMVSVSDDKGSTKYNYSLLRDYNDLNTWQKLTQNVDENNMYVPAENAEQLPGWTNKDIDLYGHEGNSLGSNIVKGLGAVLSFTPLAPLGLAMSTIASLASGNHLGGMLGAITGGLGGLGSAGMSEASNYLAKGGLGALSSLAGGAKGSNALLSGLGSGLGAYGGNAASSAFGDVLGNTGSKIFGDSVSGSIQSLFNKSNPVSGAVTGGLSSGLGSFLSSMINTGENMDTKRQKPYDALGKTIVNLANYQRMRKR